MRNTNQWYDVGATWNDAQFRGEVQRKLEFSANQENHGAHQSRVWRTGIIIKASKRIIERSTGVKSHRQQTQWSC
jgi:hypothetical protein